MQSSQESKHSPYAYHVNHENQTKSLSLLHNTTSMARTRAHHLLVLLLLTSLSLPFLPHVILCQQTCHPADLAALQGFLNGLDPPTNPWRNASSDCCRWDGVVCELTALGSVRVVELHLRDRGLRGTILESVAGLDRLRLLDLSLNSLSGALPARLFDLRLLEVLDLSENQLVGGVGDGIGNLSSLAHVDLSFNVFSGVVPDVFDKMPKLENFSARACRFSGSLPPSLSSSSNLRLLQLTNNTLSGRIDVDFGKLPRLSSLHLASNRFHGGIPESLSACKDLKNVNLARNRLTGEIPTSFETLQALSFLSLSNNSFSNISGALATLSKCANLSSLVLSLSFRNDDMPDHGIHGFRMMKALVIPYCGLRGSFPSWVESLSELTLLDLSWNHLCGSIPPWLGGLEHLFYLDLSNNSFIGEIPKSLTQLRSLEMGSSAGDGLGAEFPYYTSRQNRTRELQYNQITNFPPTLDLGLNSLSGQLWREFGNLKRLHVLNLSKNNISGSIPLEFSGMRSLEVLDLSSNNLSGTIPSSLAQLTFLSKFSVANNHLQGMIPTSGQFPTFPSTSFEGNPDLCGEFFSQCPGPGNKSGPSPVVEEENGIDILGLPFCIGIIVGFLSYVILCRKMFCS